MKNRKKSNLPSNIKTLRLDEEEKEILHAIEEGQYTVVKNVEQEIAKAKKAATNSLNKDARINIRVSSVDLEQIKQKAAYEGLPYQTLIASILHKYAAGHFNKWT